MRGRPFEGILLSCEHATNRVPARYADLFAGARQLLDSHRGYDLGARAVVLRLARRVGAPLFTGSVTRLLVDLNRSPGHPRQFSDRVRALPRAERQRIVDAYYRPHRDRLERTAATLIAGGRRVVHLSVHSFTPVLDGERRNADVGLLYDPSRSRELALALRWRDLLVAADPDLRVRRNYPYRGTADGFIPFLRRRFRARDYVGIEIELNQQLLRRNQPRRRQLISTIEQTVVELLAWAGWPGWRSG